MRSLKVLLCAAVVLGAGVARAADDDAKAIIEKAIKAHGGEENLKKYQAGRSKAKGKLETQFGELEITVETAYQLPDKMKEAAEFEVMGKQIKTVALINGDKVSVEANGNDIDPSDAVKEALHDGAKRLSMARLLPLREKKFDLSVIGESKILDKPAIGIKVSAKGMKDVSLYFDKKTNLLVKVEGRTKDPMSGEEISEERVIAEYNTKDTMPTPKKVIINRDGKKYLELDIQEIKYLEKIDEAEFKK
jgi:hypothetical protein